MHISLISLRVPYPEAVSAWYMQHLGLTITARHPQTGRIVLATDAPGTSVIFLLASHQSILNGCNCTFAWRMWTRSITNYEQQA